MSLDGFKFTADAGDVGGGGGGRGGSGGTATAGDGVGGGGSGGTATAGDGVGGGGSGGQGSGGSAGNPDTGVAGTGDNVIGGTGGDGGTPDQHAKFVVTSHVPDDGDVLQDTGRAIEVEFSQAVDAGSVSNSTFRVTLDGIAVAGRLEVDDARITFTADKPWTLSAHYVVRLTDGIRNQEHRQIESVQFEFKVRPGRWTSTQHAGSDTELAAAPQLLLTPGGQGALSWYYGGQKYGPSRTERLLPNGSWSEPTNTGIWAARGFALNDAGHIAAAHGNGPDPRADFYYYDGTWSSFLFPDGAVPLGVTDLTLNTADVVTVLGSASTDSAAVLAVSSTKLGQAFPTGVILANLRDSRWLATLTEFDQSWLAVWLDASEADAGAGLVLYATRCAGCDRRVLSTGSAAFSTPVVVSDPPRRSAIALWLQDDQSWTTVWAARMIASSDWAASQAISDGHGAASDPCLGLDARGNATAVWLQTEGSAAMLQSATLDTATGKWSASELLTTSSEAEIHSPVIAVEPSGQTLALWIERTQGASGELGTLRWARGAPGEGWAVEMSPLSPMGASVTEVALAMDGLGRARAAWIDQQRLWVASYE